MLQPIAIRLDELPHESGESLVPNWIAPDCIAQGTVDIVSHIDLRHTAAHPHGDDAGPDLLSARAGEVQLSETVHAPQVVSIERGKPHSAREKTDKPRVRSAR